MASAAGGKDFYFIQVEDIRSPKSSAAGELWELRSDEFMSPYDSRKAHLVLRLCELSREHSTREPISFPKECSPSFLPIDSTDFHLLLPVKARRARVDLFRQKHGLLKWAAKLSPGSRVAVYVKNEDSNIELLTGIVRYAGRLHDAGCYFGIELDPEHDGKGTSDGVFRKRRYFECQAECAVFVSVDKLEPLTSPGLSLVDSAYTSDQSKSPSEGLTPRSVESMVQRCPLRISDRVVWMSDNGPERGTVRWIGVLPDAHPPQDAGQLTVGVEFDKPIGSGTGRYRSQTLFTAKRRHASLVPIMGLMKESDLFPEFNLQLSPYVFEDCEIADMLQGASVTACSHDLPDVVGENERLEHQSDVLVIAAHGSQSSVARKGSVQPPSVADANVLCSVNRGIQPYSDKCTLESLIFAVFAFYSDFDKKLFAPPTDSLSGEVKTVLVEEIVNPLRASYYVSRDRMSRFGELFSMIQTAKLTGCAISTVSLSPDPVSIISTMLSDLLLVDALFELCSSSGYAYDVDVTCTSNTHPSLQHMLECSVALHSELRLACRPPSVFVVHVDSARFARHMTCGRIFPCSVLDVSSVLQCPVSACRVCGHQGSWVCGTCFTADSRRQMTTTTSTNRLDEYAFCDECFPTYHKPASRQDHQPYRVPHGSDAQTGGERREDLSLYDLYAIVSLVSGRYVTFVKVGSAHQPAWLMYDGKAARVSGGGCVPEIRRCQEIETWLTDIPAAQKADTLPEVIVRLTSGVRLCFYRPRHGTASS